MTCVLAVNCHSLSLTRTPCLFNDCLVLVYLRTMSYKQMPYYLAEILAKLGVQGACFFVPMEFKIGSFFNHLKVFFVCVYSSVYTRLTFLYS